MFLQPVLGYFKNLAQSFSGPQTYGSALEYYIVVNQPKDAADVDRLTREFECKRNQSWGAF